MCEAKKAQEINPLINAPPLSYPLKIYERIIIGKRSPERITQARTHKGFSFHLPFASSGYSLNLILSARLKESAKTKIPRVRIPMKIQTKRKIKLALRRSEFISIKNMIGSASASKRYKSAAAQIRIICKLCASFLP